MQLDYVPLLQTQRELQGIPRGRERFQKYLRSMLNDTGTDVDVTPLLVMNPMANDHVTHLLDHLIALEADAVAAQAISEVSPELEGVPGHFKASLVVADDLKGGWTNRYAYEYDFRFRFSAQGNRPQDARRFWVTGILWSSEIASERTARETILSAVYRTAYVQMHGQAKSLREMLEQEGRVMASAGMELSLDDEDLAYTREVIKPFFDANDMRTGIECLFGDHAARSLGFTPRGLRNYLKTSS